VLPVTRDYDHELVPPGVPPVMRVAHAAWVLGDMDPRLLMRWCRSGYARPMPRLKPGDMFWLPAAEVARLADALRIDPVWDAVL
jgi:hypothetical protein